MSDGPFIVPLEGDISTSQQAAPLIGGKAQSLIRMQRAGLSVPPGFVLTTTACRAFLEGDGLWPAGLREVVSRGLDSLEARTGRTFGDGSRALQVAVRSGAPVSMPGAMLTLLNRGSRAAVEEAIAAVFRSWNNASAREFRRWNGLNDASGTAVVVQEMRDTQFAGVLFTRDPQQSGSREMIVEAVLGTGDVLVAGRGLPARWRVDRETFEVTSADQDSAAFEEFRRTWLTELCRQAQRLAALWEEELDLEWGVADGQLVFFQARPIPPALQSSMPDLQARVLKELQALTKNERRVWVRHSLNESLPLPTPFTWSVIAPFLSGAGGLGRLYRRLGYAPSRPAQQGLVDLIGGRIYVDIDRQSGMFCEGYPLRFDPAVLRDDPERIDRGPTKFPTEGSDPWLLFRLPGIAAMLWRVQRRRGQLVETAEREFQKCQQELRTYVMEERLRVLRELSDETLLRLLDDRRRRVLDELAPQAMLPGTLAAAIGSEFRSKLEQWLGPAVGARMFREILSAIPNPTVQRQQELLSEVGPSDEGLEAFLAEYGHRGPGEMELSIPRWRETPDLVLQMAEASRGSPVSVEIIKPSAVHHVLRTRMREAGASSLFDGLQQPLAQIARLIPLRDAGRHLFLLAYRLLRDVTEELARRWGLGNRFYFLRIEELREFHRTPQLDSLLTSRFEEWRQWRGLRLPAVLDSDRLDEVFAESKPDPKAFRLKASPLAPGQATGRVQLLDHTRFAEGGGSILVCESIDAAALPLLAQAAGVITEQGGLLSHGALLARQLAIPTVVLPDARQKLRSGMAVRLDADAGQIELVERQP